MGNTSTLFVSDAGATSVLRSGANPVMEIAVVSSELASAESVPEAIIRIPGSSVFAITATLSRVVRPSADAIANPYSPRPWAK